MKVTSEWYSSIFLNSAYWKIVKDAALDRDEHRCCFCGSSQRLHVHHLSYYFLDKLIEEKINPNKYIPSAEQLQSELSVLITLCEDCHKKYHRAKDQIQRLVKDATKSYNDDLMDVLTEVVDEVIGDLTWSGFSPGKIAGYLKTDIQRESKRQVLKDTNVTSVVKEISQRHTMRLMKKKYRRVDDGTK